MCGESTDVEQLAPTLSSDWIEQKNELNEVQIKENRITQQTCPDYSHEAFIAQLDRNLAVKPIFG